MHFLDGAVRNGQLLCEAWVFPERGAEPLSLEKGDCFVASALIDTGATCSCISTKVAEQLSLNPYSKERVVMATEARTLNAYRVVLGIPTGHKQDRKGIMLSNLLPPVKVIEIGDNLKFDVIVGHGHHWFRFSLCHQGQVHLWATPLAVGKAHSSTDQNVDIFQ